METKFFLLGENIYIRCQRRNRFGILRPEECKGNVCKDNEFTHEGDVVMFDRLEGRRIRLGVFEVGSGILRVSDPCYEVDTWCSGTFDNAMLGKWRTHITKSSNTNGWGDRCVSLVIEHDSIIDEIPENLWKKSEIIIGVDSGQAGFFDDKYYRASCNGIKCFSLEEQSNIASEWYQMCCDVTLSEDGVGAGVIPYGVVSSSGFGDGGYECFFAENDGKVVSAMIVFITKAMA